jgi:uncharacterized membrane protein
MSRSVVFYDGASFDHADGTITVGGYDTVEDEGTPLTQRTTLDFQGSGVTAADSGGVTVVTIPGGSGGYDTVEDEGTPLTQRSTIDFQGAGVTAADSGGVTVVTIPGGSSGAASHILLADGRGCPFTFEDMLQMDDCADFMWSDPE